MAQNATNIVIDYGWKDEFISKPAKGAVIHDATNATLVLDMKNSLDEKFHFEIEPWDSRKVQSRETGNMAFGDKTEVKLLFPI